jgi:hypothetical protein
MEAPSKESKLGKWRKGRARDNNFRESTPNSSISNGRVHRNTSAAGQEILQKGFTAWDG